MALRGELEQESAARRRLDDMLTAAETVGGFSSDHIMPYTRTVLPCP